MIKAEQLGMQRLTGQFAMDFLQVGSKMSRRVHAISQNREAVIVAMNADLMGSSGTKGYGQFGGMVELLAEDKLTYRSSSFFDFGGKATAIVGQPPV